MRSSRSRLSALGAVVGLAAVLTVSGCGDVVSTPDAPSVRPPDGLLDDRDLQRIVEFQTARDGGALLELLQDPRPEVRARAALALGSVQAPEAVPALLAALGDDDPSVRRDAAFALGQARDSSAVGPLVGAYSAEGDVEVRGRIMEALSKIRFPEAAEALANLSVEEGEEAERVLALARLAGAGGVATFQGQDHLLAHLDDPDPRVRLGAAYYFGRVPSPQAWAAHAVRVREVLDGYDRDDPAAMYLIQGIGRLGDPADASRLRDWLASGRDWRTRVNAAAALGTQPADPQTREALLAALDDAAELVAVSAGEALSGGTPVPSELQRMKGWITANPERWQAAAPLLIALARGDEREFVFAWIDALPADDPYRWSVGFQALASMPGSEAVERLRGALDAPDPRIQGGAVSALVRRWNQDKVFAGSSELYFGLFARVLGSGSLLAAYSAAQALADPYFGEMGAARVLMDAWGTMSAPDQIEPMMAVLEALGRIGDPQAAPLLREAATSPHAALRQTAVSALEAMGLEAPAVDAPSATEGGTTVTRPSLEWPYLAALGPSPALVLETEQGTVRVRLHTEGAPLTVQTVARLAEEGKYDGTAFHRVVPNFVAQGGDFSSGDGFGGPGFTITSEFNLLRFHEGVAGMASAGKDTEGSQFFITHAMQPHLDGAYTTFGWVESGMDVVNRLGVGDRIVRATVERGR